MTYTFPKTLAPLREYLRGQGADVKSFVSARQAAFMAQQLLGTRVKFPSKGEDMTSTLFLIQKAVTPGLMSGEPQRGRALREVKAPATGRSIGKSAPIQSRQQRRAGKVPVACDYSSGIHIFCDGAAVPNPGVGGWGYAVYVDGVEQRFAYGGDPETTNNAMELTALLVAIERAVQLWTPGELITIWSDSQYAVEGTNTWLATWKARGWNKRKLNSPKRADGGIKNLELWQAIDEAMTAVHGAQIAVRWVKGHAGIAGNERADELAEMGRQEAGGAGLRGRDDARQSLVSGADLALAPRAAASRLLPTPADECRELDERYRQIMGAM